MPAFNAPAILIAVMAEVSVYLHPLAATALVSLVLEDVLALNFLHLSATHPMLK